MVWVPSLEVILTIAVSAASLLAVWFPFHRALRLSLRARQTTRRVGSEELHELAPRDSEGRESFSLLMVRVLRDSVREGQGQPTEFIRDATKQYVLNEYEASFAHPISMYSNILPPIGFIGTTAGLMVLFLAMHLSSESLRLSALAIALTSSVLALIGFAVLEGLKIKLYGRLLLCIDDALRARPVA